ncbi:MAG: glutaredoxin family protein [Clostridiales bacterium]|nr:glutaredoxin family protein [Clostridiales bacterium]
MAEFIKVEGNEICDIKVYALSTCIWCKRAKAFFEKHYICYSYIFIDLLPEKEQEKLENMLGEISTFISYPIIISDTHDPIVGYNEKKLRKLIGIKSNE